jgi:putative acetyltransferase
VPVEIVVPETAAELDAVRSLIRAFVAWHRERHVEDHQLIDSYFDEAAFEAELAGLPGSYRPLLLALCDEEPAGCVALRRLGHDDCEMKRMYVDGRFRGRGVGRALTERLLADARALGYRRMRLDTSVRQTEALALYERFGFTPIEPYYELAPEMRDWLVFRELDLRRACGR